METSISLIKEIQMPLETSISLIKEIIDLRFIGLKRMFTAFQVSLEVQEAAKENGVPVERHSEMREFIHKEIQSAIDSSQWQREKWDVGASEKAFLYYPIDADPNEYVPLSRQHANVEEIVNVEQPPLQISTIKGRCRDHRGYLTIPAVLLKACGFHPQDTVPVYQKAGFGWMVVGKSKTDESGVLCSEYTVDHSGNIRISLAVLEAANCIYTSKDTYEFSKVENQIFIRLENAN